MRILVVSNLYPPHVIGGYELGCRDIVDALKLRGHDLLVLTSTYGVGGTVIEPGIRRELRREESGSGFDPRTYLRERDNRRCFLDVCESFRPELIYFWNQGWLPGALVRLAHESGTPYVFYISDHYITTWSADSPWRWWCFAPRQPLKAFVKRVGERFFRWLRLIDDDAKNYFRHHRQFTSRYIQGLCSPPLLAGTDRVIPWGVDLRRFSYAPGVRPRPVRLLYVGQLVALKGVHTAIEAVRLLRDRFRLDDVSLTLFGGTTDPDYRRGLEQLVAREKLERHVRFAGKVDRAELAGIYHEYSILVFPSEWEEPFAITPLEAMASGLVVVGTPTGGSKEIFAHRENAMVFAPGNAEECARAVFDLVQDPALYERLRERGRRTIEERYSLGPMVDAVEQHLLASAGYRDHPSPADRV